MPKPKVEKELKQNPQMRKRFADEGIYPGARAKPPKKKSGGKK